MELFDMLTYFEVSEVNNKLDKIKNDAEEYRERSDAINTNTYIAKLFQQLYVNDNDISKIDLSNIPTVKQWIYDSFEYKKRNSFKPSYSFSTYFWIIIIALIASFFFDSTITFTLASIIIALALYGEYRDRSAHDKKIDTLSKEIPLLKMQMVDLTAYGIFLKYTIDTQCEEIISILKNRKDNKDPYQTLKTLYSVFGMKAQPFMRYNIDIVANFNETIINRIEQTQIKNYKYMNGNYYYFGVNIQYANGDRYRGSLKNGLPFAKGKTIFHNGDIYIGCFEDGLRNGFGIYKFNKKNYDLKSGNVYYDCYTGYWKNGLFHRYGKLKYTNGEQYRGDFKNDKREGYGIFRYNNGRIIKGKWENDQFIREFANKKYYLIAKVTNEKSSYNHIGNGRRKK